MSKQVKWRRGTTAEHATFIGAIGEVTVDTTLDTLVVHDGVTTGGQQIPSPFMGRDYAGVKAELYRQAGITDNGTQNTLGNSQFVEGVKQLAGRRNVTRAKVESGVLEVGDLVTVIDRANAPFNIEPLGIYVVNGMDIIQAGVDKVAVLSYYDSRIVDPLWLGAKFNNTGTDSPFVDRAMTLIGTTGAMRLSKIPRLTSPIVFNPNSLGVVIFSMYPIVVKCAHNGIGVNITLTNENYGGNVFENITFDGPNTHYPAAGYVPTSAGSGLHLRSCWDTTLINTSFWAFREGCSILSGYNNKTVGNCSFLFNQEGVLLLSGGLGCNLNKFEGARIRENRICGVRIDGSSGGPYPTGNSFKGAYIETNIPYAGGYPIGGAGNGSNSVGVIIDRAYDNDFEGAYFENQEFDIICRNLASGNNFNKTRHAPSTDYSRIGKILLSGVGVNNNTFDNAIQISRNRTDVHVITQGAEQYGNTFINTIGFNFIDGSLETKPYISNNRDYGLIGGTVDGTISRPPQGYVANPVEGTTTGKISGIGTAAATLYVAGLAEVQLGSQITAPTTITTFNGLKRGSMLIVWNYQIAHPVTIKSGTATGQIVNNGLVDIVLDNYGDSAFFWVNGLGRAVEIGRNIK